MTDQFQEFVNAPADPPPPSLFGFDSQVRLYQEICRRRRALRFQAEYSGKVNSFLWKLTERRLDQIQRELVTALRLDKQHVITCTAKKFRAEFGMRVEEQSRALFGDYVPRKRRQRDDVLVEQILEQVRNATRRSRLKEVMWRLQCELESRHAERWFCIFATLTVDPRYSTDVLSGPGWTKFRQKIQRRAEKASGRSGAAAFQSFAVLERGAKNGREHVHAVFMMRDVPDEWKKDPNAGRRVPNFREISALKSEWQFGHSFMCALRFANGDAWGDAGWVWPVERAPHIAAGWCGIKASQPAVVSGYMSKYVSKSLDNELPEDQSWRTRMTQGLGVRPLKEALQRLQLSNLRALITLETSEDLEFLRRPVPLQLLRREAAKVALAKILRNPKARYSIRQWCMVLERRPSLPDQLRSLIGKKSMMCNRPKIGAMLTRILTSMASSECQIPVEIIPEKNAKLGVDSRKKLMYALRHVEELYFGPPPQEQLPAFRDCGGAGISRGFATRAHDL